MGAGGDKLGVERAGGGAGRDLVGRAGLLALRCRAAPNARPPQSRATQAGGRAAWPPGRTAAVRCRVFEPGHILPQGGDVVSDVFIDSIVTGRKSVSPITGLSFYRESVNWCNKRSLRVIPSSLTTHEVKTPATAHLGRRPIRVRPSSP